MQAVSVVGFKNSGKTTFAVELARELTSRGKKVAAAKFSHHGFDLGATDTSRLAEVCCAVAGISDETSMMIWKEKRFLPDLLPLMDADILIVEGGKQLGWLPRIILPREEQEIGQLSPDIALGSYGTVEIPGVLLLQNVPEAADLVLEKGFSLPGLDCGECGFESCRAMTAAIVSGQTSPSACKAGGSTVEVSVNGQKLALGHFVEGIISGAITGMLKELKGYAPGEVAIRFNSKG